MKNRKIPLSREIVKYIFPGTSPDIAESQGGYIIYDFKKMYPSDLGIFIPNEVDASNYNAIFPKSFESYFTDVGDEIAFFSRLLETPITPDLPPIGIKCIHGSILTSDKDQYTIFRFDQLVKARKRTHLLCRIETERLKVEDKLYILNTNPIFMDEATSIDGARYLYWIIPIDELFFSPREVLAAAFNTALASRER